LAEALKFTCGTCGEVHEGLPDYGFGAPIYYDQVPEGERDRRCSLNADLCKIDNEYFFVRGVLLVPILATGESFGWGVWSSLSEANFNRYLELWDAEDVSREAPYFGWLSNRLPFYPDTLELKLAVRLQNEGQRPLLELEPTDHPLALDQREGMTWARAVEMIEKLRHGDESGADG
jgi:hypothetical protein